MRWNLLQVLTLIIILLVAGIQASSGMRLNSTHYEKYTVANVNDTFRLCMQESGRNLTSKVSAQELLNVFGLPNSIEAGGISLSQLQAILQSRVSQGHAEPNASLLGSSGQLPRLLHMTVKDLERLSYEQAISIASWALLNPRHQLHIYQDADIRLFVEARFPDLLPTLDALSSPVERTDMWRYLVLCAYGGVYVDSDVICAQPVDNWLQDARLLVGIENAFQSPTEAEQRTYARQVQMLQWVIAAQPGHEVLCRMGAYIRRHVLQEQAGVFAAQGWSSNRQILERTGPGIWSASVFNYLREHGVKPEDVVAGALVGDMRVLPQTAFGCPAVFANVHNGSLSPRSSPYVYHQFSSSWKMDESILERMISGFRGYWQSKHKDRAQPKINMPSTQQQQQQQQQHRKHGRPQSAVDDTQQPSAVGLARSPAMQSMHTMAVSQMQSPFMVASVLLTLFMVGCIGYCHGWAYVLTFKARIMLMIHAVGMGLRAQFAAKVQ